MSLELKIKIHTYMLTEVMFLCCLFSNLLMCALFVYLYIGWMYILPDLSKALSPVGSTKLSFVIKSPQIATHRGHVQHMIKCSTAATYLLGEQMR